MTFRQHLCTSNWIYSFIQVFLSFFRLDYFYLSIIMKYRKHRCVSSYTKIKQRQKSKTIEMKFSRKWNVHDKVDSPYIYSYFLAIASVCHAPANIFGFLYTLGHEESAKIVAFALLSLYRCDKLRFLRRQKMYFENFCLNFCESHPNVWKFKAETKVCRRWLRNSDPKFEFSKSSF